MGPGGFDEISIFLFLTCFSDEGWKPGPGQETNDTQMSQGDQNKHKLVYNDFRNICMYIYIIGLVSLFPFWEPLIPMHFREQIISIFNQIFLTTKPPKRILQ